MTRIGGIAIVVVVVAITVFVASLVRSRDDNSSQMEDSASISVPQFQAEPDNVPDALNELRNVTRQQLTEVRKQLEETRVELDSVKMRLLQIKASTTSLRRMEWSLLFLLLIFASGVFFREKVLEFAARILSGKDKKPNEPIKATEITKLPVREEPVVRETPQRNQEVSEGPGLTPADAPDGAFDLLDLDILSALEGATREAPISFSSIVASVILGHERSDGDIVIGQDHYHEDGLRSEVMKRLQIMRQTDPPIVDYKNKYGYWLVT